MAALLPDWIAALPGFDAGRDYNTLTLAGVKWHNGRWAGSPDPFIHHHVERDGRTVLISIGLLDTGEYQWESAITMIQSEWYVRAKGRSVTLDQAIADAIAWNHARFTVVGTDWYAGRTVDGTQTREAKIDDQIVVVTETEEGTWRWARHFNLDALKALGFAIWSELMSGVCQDPLNAIHAALDAPAVLRNTLRQMLSDLTPRTEAEIIDFTLAEKAA